MEVNSLVPGIGGDQPISLINGEFLRRLSGGDLESLRCLLESFGKKSAAAQGLGAVVTDIHKLRNTDQRLYLFASRQGSSTIVHGGLKIGTKKLFVIADDNSLQEIIPTCVLDFYVHESCQRKGIGKELFEHFLASENQHPGNVAYDRPSPKLLAFLAKHYGLRAYILQNNNFVVFNIYWSLNPHKASNRHGRDGLRTFDYQRQQPLSSKTVPPPRSLHGPPLADCSNTGRPVASSLSYPAPPSHHTLPPASTQLFGTATVQVGHPSSSPYNDSHPAVGMSQSGAPTSPQGVSAPSAQQPWVASSCRALSRGDSLDRFKADAAIQYPSAGTGQGDQRQVTLHSHPLAPCAAPCVQSPNTLPYSQTAFAGSAASSPTARQAMRVPRLSGPLSLLDGAGMGSASGVASQPQSQQQLTPTQQFASRPPWGEYDAHGAGANGRRGPGAGAALPLSAYSQQQQEQGVSSPAATGSVSKVAARAQRSGIGAASCLVW